MEKLHKPDASRQDYYAFVNELKLFHQNRGTPFRNVPKINGREIDLQKLYNQVTALGGLQKVIDGDKWDVVAEVLNLPKACANFSLGLRQIYIRYLAYYEKIHFLGEDPDHDKNHASESHNRKLQLTLLHHVPMLYNSLQHDITDIARSTSGLNQKFINPTDYDKLCMSLLCGLPNEQEMALNVCTILSNEGNYMLHLEHCPKLVKLLVAQAGIFPLDDNSLKFLYLQSWKGLKGRNMERFWRNTLQYQDSSVVQLLDFDLGDNDPNDSLLNLESDLGVLNVEGQRALRVALILHNLSFEKNNIPVLVADKNCIRFLLLSVYSSWTNLKQTAYDTLSNIACEIKLSIEKDIFSRIIFQTVMKGILSSDRYMNIRSMDILSQLCSYEPNEEIIPSRVDVEVYQHMVSFLSVHDIMLLIFTLEALYALSDLGRYACEKIVCVHRSIGVLVSLLTLDHNQYGPPGLIKMKVVETLVPSEFEDEPEEKTVNSPEAVTPSKELDSETFTVNWLKSSFEFLPGSLIPRNELYSEYVSYCSKVGRKNAVNTNIFAGFVKSTYPQSVIKRVESTNGPVTIYHDGLKRKESGISPPGKSTVLTSTPCKSPRPTTPVSSKPSPKQTHSPILKAQLSAPPRSTSPPLKRLTEHAANSQKSSFQPIRSSSHVSSLNSPTSGSSTLIKSLLATKVQQRNLHRQVIPQGFSKMVIYSTDKVRGQVVRTPTLLRCGRPATFTPPVRGPFQARIISSKGRIITSAPPRLKNPDIERPSLKCPSKLIKQCPPRLNGIQRDVHMEVCRHTENANNVKDISSYSKDQLNNFQNHINNDLLDAKSSVSCDGDNALSSKSMDIDNDYNKNCLQQENTIFCKVSGNSENIVLSNNVLVMKQKSPSELLNSSIEQNGSNISSIFNNDAAISEEICQSKSVPPSNRLNSVIHNMDDSLDNTIKIQKDNIYKKAPLLNGLLDKGKLQLSEENHLTALLQNGIKDIPMEVNISKSTLPVQFSNSANTPISEKSVIPSFKPSTTKISLNTSSTSCSVTSPSTTLHSSFNSVTSQSSNLPAANTCLPNCVQSSSSNLGFPTSTISNSVTNSLLNNSVETTSVNFVMPTMNTTSSSNLVSQSRMTNISLSNQTVQSSKFSDSSKFISCTSNSNLCNSSNSVTTYSSNSTAELSSNLSSEQSSNMVVENYSTPPSESPLYSSIETSPNSCVKNSLYQNSQSSTDSKTQPLTAATIQAHSINTNVQTILTNTITQTITTSSSLESNSISSETTSSQSVFPFMTNCISTISSVPSVITTSVMSPTAFHSEGDHLLKICTGQATLSGTIEVQPDQKGVVRLHIESPENSNQGSDLSSISDITRTLECASKALSESNAESNTEIPHCGTSETTATVTVITTNTPTLSRAGQQIIVVTPSLNQPQLHIQSPNIKFRILHTLPKAEERVDSVDFSHVHLNQINQFKQPSLDSPSLSASTLKRPSSNVSLCMDVKKPRMDTKTPLLEASLRLPTPVPCSNTPNVNTKSVTHENILITNTSVENSQKYSESSPKLNTIKAVPVQNIDIPSEKETKTFSGLSSICDNPSLATPSQVPSKSTSKIEFLCEWKDCGLKFPNPSSVFLHATKVHAPMCNEDMICLWEGCDSMKRKRFSLLTHLQDWHCNEKVLHIQALRRKQLSHQGKTSISPPQMPPPHPGYAPDAAFLAIRRHALQYINPKELSEDKESALTKSIRLTSALILRNLVTHSSLARTYVRRFESELAYLAMSPVESARTIAQCLSELSRSHD